MKNVVKKWMVSGLMILATHFAWAQPNFENEDTVSSTTLILTIEKQGDVFSVLSAKKVKGLMISEKEKALADGLTFLIKDRDQTVLGKGYIAHPDVLRGIQEPAMEQAHDHMTLDNTVFVIKYPYQEGMAILNILKSGVQVRSGVSSTPAQDVAFDHLLK